MNRVKRKIALVCSLFLTVWIIDSCTDIFAPAGEKVDNSKGLVRICLDGDNASVPDMLQPEGLQSSGMSVIPKTFMPLSSDASYIFKFASVPDGAVVLQSLLIQNNAVSVTLETGTWNLQVYRYERVDGANCVVAVSDPVTFTVNAGSNNSLVSVTLKPISGGTGFLKYSINCTVDGTLADLSVKPAVTGGASTQYGFTSQTIPAAIGLTGTLTLPSGDYDVIVSLKTPDGKTTGKYSAACIYPGLVTTTTTGFFDFTSANFIQALNLAGTLSIANGAGITFGQPVKVIARNSSGVEVGSYTLPSWLSTGSNPWVINISNTQERSVNLSVEATGNDGSTSQIYRSNNLLPVNGIPDIGVSTGLNLSPQIYSITKDSSSWPAGDDISVKADGTTFVRKAAFPGEKLTLDVTSTYGLKNGTLKVNGTAITGSASPYSFDMPNGNAALTASFYSAKLSSLSISDPNLELTPSFDPAIQEYTLGDVPYDVSSIKITATAEDTDAGVTIGGPYNNLSEGENNITVTVTPPDSGGGKGNRVYTITVNRLPAPT